MKRVNLGSVLRGQPACCADGYYHIQRGDHTQALPHYSSSSEDLAPFQKQLAWSKSISVCVCSSSPSSFFFKCIFHYYDYFSRLFSTIANIAGTSSLYGDQKPGPNAISGVLVRPSFDVRLSAILV